MFNIWSTRCVFSKLKRFLSGKKSNIFVHKPLECLLLAARPHSIFKFALKLIFLCRATFIFLQKDTKSLKFLRAKGDNHDPNSNVFSTSKCQSFLNTEPFDLMKCFLKQTHFRIQHSQEAMSTTFENVTW